MRKHIVIAAIASLSLAGCSDGPDNDQIGEAPPRQDSRESTLPLEVPAPAPSTRVEMPDVPPPAADEQVLDSVIDETTE